MNLQQLAVDSVKRRGFHEDANIPVAARNLYQMEYLLDKAAKLGQFARSQRKNGSVPVMYGNYSTKRARSENNTFLM